jgi:ribosomal protein L37E
MATEKERMERLFSAIGIDMERHTTPMPTMPLFQSGIQEPALLQGITIPALYAAAYECVVLRSILNHLSVETFRKGLGWKPKFVVKCRECDEEFHQQVDTCQACGGEVRKADSSQLEYAKTLLDHQNGMLQTFIEILREIEMDLNIVDDAYIIMTKEYFVDPDTKQIMFYRVKEISRADPIFMRILADKRGVRGGSQYTSLVDRTFRTSDPKKKCPVTGMPVVPIHYMNLAGVGKGQVYTEGEVIHLSKWSPSKLYGRSPVATMWRQVNTLIAMDNYVYSAYQKRRMPRGVMVIKSSNMETVERTARNIQEHLERDPNYIPTIGVETESGRGGLEYVRMMDTLEELQYIPIKDDIRQRIAAFFGVSNVFMNDVSGGGLNNEGMQIVVSNRAVAYAQSIYNRNLFPQVAEAFDVTEWELVLNPHEEEDEIMHMRRDEMAIRNMMQMKQAGFEATLRDNVDDKILHFDYRQPDPQEVAEAQAMAAQQQQQQQGGGQVAKSNEIEMTPEMLMKRTKFDSSRGSTVVPSAMVTAVDPTNDIPPLRTISQNERKSGGSSPDRVRRVEGTPTGAGSKTDSRDDKSVEEKMIDSRLKEIDKRKGIAKSDEKTQ